MLTEAVGTSSETTCIDHWHCSPELAAHTCDAPDRTKPCPTCRDAYTPAVLAVYCKRCKAPVGERCSIFSEILGHVRELREPHPARASYARRANRRKS